MIEFFSQFSEYPGSVVFEFKIISSRGRQFVADAGRIYNTFKGESFGLEASTRQGSCLHVKREFVLGCEIFIRQRPLHFGLTSRNLVSK